MANGVVRGRLGLILDTLDCIGEWVKSTLGPHLCCIIIIFQGGLLYLHYIYDARRFLGKLIRALDAGPGNITSSWKSCCFLLLVLMTRILKWTTLHKLSRVAGSWLMEALLVLALMWESSGTRLADQGVSPAGMGMPADSCMSLAERQVGYGSPTLYLLSLTPAYIRWSLVTGVKECNDK